MQARRRGEARVVERGVHLIAEEDEQAPAAVDIPLQRLDRGAGQRFDVGEHNEWIFAEIGPCQCRRAHCVDLHRAGVLGIGRQGQLEEKQLVEPRRPATGRRRPPARGPSRALRRRSSGGCPAGTRGRHLDVPGVPAAAGERVVEPGDGPAAVLELLNRSLGDRLAVHHEPDGPRRVAWSPWTANAAGSRTARPPSAGPRHTARP